VFVCLLIEEVKTRESMAEKPSVLLTDGGLWNTRKPQLSTATTQLLKSKSIFENRNRRRRNFYLALMDESRINNFQRRQLTSHMLR